MAILISVLLFARSPVSGTAAVRRHAARLAASELLACQCCNAARLISTMCLVAGDFFEGALQISCTPLALVRAITKLSCRLLPA